ncbi:MAG: ligase-associated DNA damage response exonuclease [Anaerolineae bacterium]|nr:ligase-associated DNA damage response exonuclease [Candidatus Roseilinea sp.]MDW8451054.1 ligase-associated DNA damage response exonuclease [Anaerolineae bacterium]
MPDLLRLTPAGLYCPAGDFYIDPWQPVPRAVITHAHADHLCWGCASYLVAAEGEPVVRLRLSRAPAPSAIQAVPYSEPVNINGVRVSLHPAGHILGSAQVRVEHRGQVWVVSGDYKVEPDATCTPFELQRCHVFITESTFGLPVYRWRPQREVFAEINAWWQENAAQKRASVLFGYALGKAQRLLAGVDASIGPIFVHGAVAGVNRAYQAARRLPDARYVGEVSDARQFQGALIIAPPSANGTSWMRRFGEFSSAFVSGWMQIRGARRRRAVDRGFVLSDHADWPSLVQVVRETGAERVWVTHGYNSVFARWLSEQGIAAQAIETRFVGERDDLAVEDADEAQA